MIHEITPQDIANLNDEELRALVWRLCAAELEAEREPAAGITHGGEQDASDGGVDVRVRRKSGFSDDNAYIPRSNTVFQVKKPDLAPNEIKNEMKPHGKLRDSICELGRCDGAYIIVSSGANCTDTKYRKRIDAMRDCLGDTFGNIHVDFYDRARIAAWVEKHPSVIIWVCSHLKRNPMHGWRPYDEWSGASGLEFFHDDEVRIKELPRDGNSDTAEQAINKMRSLLAQPKNAIRLVGLSGVGKTRLLQALFDENIGNDALEKSLAIYTDMGRDPDPKPAHLAEDLVNCGKRNILLIDNCSPKTHRDLAEICRRKDSNLSLITVEYDVKEDIPEETNVFSMEAASDEIIKKIIKANYPNIPDNDIHAIADFSGGNARIALLAARSYKPGDSYVGISDMEFLKRLLFQADGYDKELEQAVNVLSLVYSFDSTYRIDGNNELAVLAKLAGVPAEKLHGIINKLVSRQIAQTRGQWVAILPHALANRLADNALDEVPKEYLLETFKSEGNERLFKSFAHRIGFLHNNKKAVEIANSIITYINEQGYPKVERHLHQAVCYLAPVVPVEVIYMVYNAVTSGGISKIPDHIRNEYATAIAQIGYEEEYFERAVYTLAEFSRANRNPESNYARDVLIDYFQLYLSGTLARPEQRLLLIKKMINDSDDYYKKLGLDALKAALRYGRFTGRMTCGMSFGMRSRSYGYKPQGEQIKEWLELFVDYACELVITGGKETKAIKGFLANCSGNICYNDMFSIVEKAADKISQVTNWEEGWLVLNGILCKKTGKVNSDLRSRIAKVCKKLAPEKLEERIRACVLVRGFHAQEIAYSVDSSSAENYERQVEIAKDYVIGLGRELAKNDAVFKVILPELYTTTADLEYLVQLGVGFGQECEAPLECWRMMLDEFKRQNDDIYCARFMSGVLSQLFVRDTEMASRIADDLVTFSDMKNNVFCILARADISEGCHKRIMQLLRTSPNAQWSNIWFPQNKAYNDAECCVEFAEELIKRNNALNTILWQIESELPEGKQHKTKWENHKISLLNLMDMCITSLEDTSNIDIEPIREIIKYASTDSSAHDVLMQMANHLYDRISDTDGSSDRFERTMIACIAEANVLIALDVFLKDGVEPCWKLGYIMSGRLYDECCLKGCDNDAIMAWIARNPKERVEKLAKIIDFYTEKNGQVFVDDLAQQVIDSPHVTEVALDSLMNHTAVYSWSGNLSDIFKKRRPVAESLISHKNELVRKVAIRKLNDLDEGISVQMENERRERENCREGFEP